MRHQLHGCFLVEMVFCSSQPCDMTLPHQNYHVGYWGSWGDFISGRVAISFYLLLFLMFIYLTAPDLSCDMRDRPSSSHVRSYSMWTLGCSMWDLVAWPGIEPRPLALGVQNLSHWTNKGNPSWTFLHLAVPLFWLHPPGQESVFIPSPLREGILTCFPISCF